MKKLMNFIGSYLMIIIVCCMLTGLFIPVWISCVLSFFTFVVYFGYVIYSHSKSEHVQTPTEENEDNIKPSKFCYVDEATDCEYVVSIVYDNCDNSYRILENNSNVIFEFKFDCSDDAEQYIKEQAKDNYVIGIKCYNCVGNLIKK